MSSEARSTGQIRVGAVLGDALMLVVRRPFSVIAWGLFTTLVGFWPLSAILVSLIPRVEAAAQAAAMAGQVNTSTALLIQMAAGGVLAALLAVLVMGVGDAAIYRAVLEPDNRGFFYLKLRRRELHLVGLYLLNALIFGAVAAVAVVPLVWIIGFTAHTLGRGLAVLISLVAGLAAGVLFGLFSLRLSLAGPMTFAQSSIGLGGSWRATRDRLGGVLAIAILSGGFLAWGWTFLLSAFGHLTVAGAAVEMAASPAFGRRIVILALLSLYFGVIRVLVTAPAALILRQLSQSLSQGAARTPAAGGRPLALP